MLQVLDQRTASDGSLTASDGSLRAWDCPLGDSDGPPRAPDGPLQASDGSPSASDGSLNSLDLLGRLLTLRSSGAFDSAPLIAAVETASGRRVFRAPPLEGHVMEQAAIVEGEKLLYYCDFVHFEQQFEAYVALPVQTRGREVAPLDRDSFQRARAEAEALLKASRNEPLPTGEHRGADPAWDRAFRTLTNPDNQLVWASLIAVAKHGPRFAVELLDELAKERGRADVLMTSQVYGILRHQLRAGSVEWLAEVERAKLCWAVTRGVWERVSSLEVQSKEEGDLLKEGAALLVALIESIPHTDHVEHLPERLSGASSEPGHDSARKVWLARVFAPDLLKLYGACGKFLQSSLPAQGVPTPAGGFFYEGPGLKGAVNDNWASRIAREIRAATRRGLMAAQWLHERTGRGGWFPGGDKLLLTHDAAAEGDFEVTLAAHKYRQASPWLL